MGFCHSKDRVPRGMYDVNKCDINSVGDLSLSGKLLRCKCIDVYDGDTITVIVPIGKTAFKQKCRLHGIDAPELRTCNLEEKRAGVTSKDWLAVEIKNKIVWIEFQGRGKYGRLLGVVYKSYEDSLVYENSLNACLVAGGMAVPYDGGKRKKWQVVS